MWPLTKKNLMKNAGLGGTKTNYKKIFSAIRQQPKIFVRKFVGVSAGSSLERRRKGARSALGIPKGNPLVCGVQRCAQARLCPIAGATKDYEKK